MLAIRPRPDCRSTVSVRCREGRAERGGGIAPVQKSVQKDWPGALTQGQLNQSHNVGFMAMNPPRRQQPQDVQGIGGFCHSSNSPEQGRILTGSRHPRYPCQSA